VLGTDASPHLPLAGVLALIVLALCAGPATAKAPSSGGGPGYACGINTPFLCVQGGTTKLTFRASWLARVRRNGWRMAVIPPAVRRGNVLTMPIVKTGKLTLIRRSRVGGDSSRLPGGECHTDGGLIAGQTAIHHTGGFALLRRGVRRPFDALVLRPQTFYWRGPDHREFGAKGPNSGTFGGDHGSPRDDTTSPNQGRTVISALRVTEVDTLEGGGQLGPVLGVMGSTDSRWRVDAYCQVISPTDS
jgi:hypothetical protein